MTNRKALVSRTGAAAIAMLFLAACSGGSDAPAGNQNVGGGTMPVNRAPSIGGTPATTIVRDEPYSFTPSTSDPDEDTLSFSIENSPAWASFDLESGSLTGMPGIDDIGTTSAVTITVSDGALSVSL
jgi:hypothetical protein